uniref:FBD domain-containing protein n=1 Tax=Oryza brachyantha TaxID=4533 RepID=J3LC89_ORYBR
MNCRTTCMKSLRLLDCMEIADKGLVAVGKTSPCLEELELTTCSIDILLKVVGQAFPNLKCLWLNNRWFDIQLDEFRDNFHALGIACSMPKLRHLQLFANRLRNNALAAILDNCLHLESLDLRQCFNVYVDAELQAKCVRLKDVRFPNDSTKDYEYETFFLSKYIKMVIWKFYASYSSQASSEPQLHPSITRKSRDSGLFVLMENQRIQFLRIKFL